MPPGPAIPTAPPVIPQPSFIARAAPTPAENPFLIDAPPAFAIEQPEELDETQLSGQRPAHVAWRLVLDDGRTFPLAKPVLIGRDASADKRWPGATIVSVNEATTSVSKTHAAVEVEAGGIWVTDLTSTNGVFVEQPDGREFTLVPNQRTIIAPGSDILIGDYGFTVVAA